MRKLYTTILSVIGLVGFSNVIGQVSGYTLTASSGTFTPITGGTDVDVIEVDTYLSGDLPIGFTFDYDGNSYTTFRASSNGFISFGTSTSSQTTNNLDAVTATSRPLIAPLWDDHAGSTSSLSQASYVLTGTAPNRVLTFEWFNWEWNYATTTPVISFQVKLYETSNVIEFIYQDAGTAVNNGSASIGLTGVSDFLSLDGTSTSPTMSSTTETANINTKPANGQTYTFTPPTCPGVGSLSVTNLTTTSAEFNWVENGSATEWEVVYGTSGFTPSPSGTTTTNNPEPSGTLTASTDYEFYVRSVCGVGDTSVWVGPYAFTTPCASAIAPWTEGFENAGTIPNCWTMTGGENWLFNTSGPNHVGNAGTLTGATTTGNYYAVVDATGTDAPAELYSPMIDVSSLSYPMLTFYEISDNEGNSNSQLDVEVWDGAAWNLVGTYNTNTNGWEMKTILLYGLTFTGDAQIKFTFSEVIDPSDFYDDIAIDDITLSDGPACPDPSNLISTWTDNDSLAFSWTAGYSETMWNVEVVPMGMTPGTGNEVFAGTSSATMDTATGLSQLTDYDIYIQADCGGNLSTWVGPLSATTDPNCPDVSNIMVDAQSGDSLFISWTSNGTESSWDIEYGPTGFTTGTGTMMTSSATNDTIFGVMSGMSYDIYVRSDCGGVDQGAWIGPISYTASCTDLIPVTLPFIEDFESYAGTSVGDSLFYCGPTHAWQFTTTDQTYGRIRFGSDAFGMIGGTGAMTLDVSDDNNYATDYAILTVDLSNYSSSADLKFSCDYMEHGDETHADDKVWIRGSINDTWIEVLDWNSGTGGTSDVTFQLVEFDLSTNLAVYSQTPSSTFQVRFGWYDNYTANPSTSDGITFDNIKIEEVTCSQPLNIAVTYSNADTVVIDWFDNAGASEWAFEYGPQGFTPGSGTMVSTMNHPDTVTNLIPGNLYDFYVAAVCGVGDTSNWNGPNLVVPNVTNDSACYAITLAVDSSTTYFANHGSSNTGEPGNTMYNTVWFEFVAPTSGHVAIATCGAIVSNEISIFDTVSDCADYNTFSELDWASSNPWGCAGNNTPAGLEVCGLTPGETYKIKVGDASSTQGYHTFPITLWDLDYEAGTGATVGACAGIDTVNLVSLISGSHSLFPGTFEYSTNSATIVDDTLAVAGNFTLGNSQVMYIVQNDCMADTAYVTINVSSGSSSGEPISPFVSCNSDVFLYNALSGTVDNGGTWTDDASTGLLAGQNNDVFVGGDAPAGNYPFTYTVSDGICPASSTTITVTITDCSDIDENAAAISMYPNPNNGSFFIVSDLSGENNIVITDISGKVIYNNVANLSAGAPFEITLDNVETGMYLMNIRSNEGNRVMNLIIK